MANGHRRFYKVRKNLAGQEKKLNLALRVSFKSIFLGWGKEKPCPRRYSVLDGSSRTEVKREQQDQAEYSKQEIHA